MSTHRPKPTNQPRPKPSATMTPQREPRTFAHGVNDWDKCDHCNRLASQHYCAEAAGAPLREALERLRGGVHEYMEQSNRYGHGLTIDRDDFDTYLDATIEQYAATPAPARCDQIVNNGMGEPTECGRTLPCEYHDEPAPAPLDVEEHGPYGNEGYCRCGYFVGHYGNSSERCAEHRLTARAAATEDTDAPIGSYGTEEGGAIIE